MIPRTFATSCIFGDEWRTIEETMESYDLTVDQKKTAIYLLEIRARDTSSPFRAYTPHMPHVLRRKEQRIRECLQ